MILLSRASRSVSGATGTAATAGVATLTFFIKEKVFKQSIILLLYYYGRYE